MMTTRQKRKFKKFKKKSNINVLLVTSRDWTSLGEQYARCLRSIGVDAKMMIKRKHVFNYPDQGMLFKNLEDITSYIEKADVIHFMHSQKPIPNSSLKGKKVVVSHTGTSYRKGHAKLNKIFNPIVDLTIVSGDLFGKGAKNEHYSPGCVVDTEKLKPVYERQSDKLIVGHFPSSTKQTNGDKIAKILKNVKGNFKFDYNPTRVSWEEQIKRMSGCDIYIECLMGIGGFGITALESASLGKILFTPYRFEDKYKEVLGDFIPIIFQPGGKDLVEKIEKFISLPNDELLRLKKESRDWVEKNYSYKAVGNRLLGLYNSI